MSTDMITRYPLAWPTDWPRKTDAQRSEARFGRGTSTEHRWADGTSIVYRGKKALTVSDGTNRVLDELARLGARPGSTIISTNVAVRLDGLPRSGQRGARGFRYTCPACGTYEVNSALLGCSAQPPASAREDLARLRAYGYQPRIEFHARDGIRVGPAKSGRL